jgi:hypothetical protein
LLDKRGRLREQAPHGLQAERPPIAGNPDHVTDPQLADTARPILDRLYRRELAAAIARFDELNLRLAMADISYEHFSNE